MDAAATLRRARIDAGLSQAALAERTGTSQATISAYESGRKQPTVLTLSRLLAAAGWRLTAEPGPPPVREWSAAELRAAGRELADVLDLAAALPVRHERTIDVPPIKSIIEGSR
jgi:transcriptional regulator with XRE-family HTH domain